MDELHRLRIPARAVFERSKQIVCKTARRREDTNFSARRQTRFELRLDLLRENLQAIVNRAVQRVFEEDAVEQAVVVLVVIVDHTHHARGVAFLQEQAAQLRKEKRRLAPGAAEPFLEQVAKEVTVVERLATNRF